MKVTAWKGGRFENHPSPAGSALERKPALNTSAEILNTAAGGWTIGALGLLQSGPIFTVSNSVNQTNAASLGTVRPNLVGDPTGSTSPLSKAPRRSPSEIQPR